MFVARSKRAAFIRYRRTFSMRRKLEYMRVSKYLIMLSIFVFLFTFLSEGGGSKNPRVLSGAV